MVRLVSSLIASLLLLLVTPPTMAQFGVAGGKRKQATFQEMQEMAKQQQAGGGVGGGDAGLGDMADLMKQMNSQYAQALEQLSKMSPEEIQKQMEDALAMMTEGTMVDAIIEKKDEVLQSLAQTGAVPADELAKMKADPNYFDQKIRESFGQMQEIFNNPEYLKMATQAMAGISDIMTHPEEAMNTLAETMKEQLGDDDKIEEARLEILKNMDTIYAGLFDSDEMKEIVNDPVKWRETVKGGVNDLLLKDGAAAALDKDEL